MPEDSTTLANCVDEYLLSRQISKKKYYAGYLNAARWAWRELFQNTIYSVQSEWLPLRKGEPYDYIDVPKNLQRLFTVAVTNHCNNIIPLYYNNYANIISEPKVSACGCGVCSCEGGLCNDIAALTKLTKLLFTVSGIDYYETIWLKLCPNGDILEYRNVPIKKYNNYTGDGGDYNSDYNNDYLIANPPFSDYEIVYQDFQRILCKLDVKPCGCPKNTTENADLFLQHCAGFCNINVTCGTRERLCKLAQETNYDNCILGTIKMSECGTRIYYIPPPRLKGQLPAKLPKYLLVNYQTTGEDCSTQVIVPQYAIETMFYGIHFKSTRFNMSIPRNDKQQIKYDWTDAQNKLILYLSNLNLDRLSAIQDQPILF